MRHHEGTLRTKPVPILTMTSDQGSNLFATHVHLAYTIGLRLVYFPDINHIEANVENGIFDAIGFGHLTEKSFFLSRLHHAPKRSEGRWHVQIKYAFKVGGLEAIAAKGKSDPGLPEADGTGVAGGVLLGFKILAQQHVPLEAVNLAMDQRFQIGDLLKHGRFSDVYLATHRTDGAPAVLKRPKSLVWGAVLSEVMFLERCKHPHVVQLMDVFGGANRILLAFKFAGQPLVPHPECKSWGQTEKALIMKQVLTALEFLHEKSVIHRDVRPCNILIQTCPIHIVLSDFSQCMISLPGFLSQPWCEQAAATLNYAAPEFLLGCGCIDDLVDLWSCGCVFAQLLLGKPLWNETNSKSMLKCMWKLLGSPSPEDLSVMQSYPSWQPQFASPVVNTWDQAICKNGSSEDAWDLVRKLLQWSPGRPPKFKHEAIPTKPIHIAIVL